MSVFVSRHIGLSSQETAQMLKVTGYPSADELVKAAVPENILSAPRSTPSTLPSPATEEATLEELAALGAKNRVTTSLIGQGYYDTLTPQVIQRNVLENPSWYTAYTPYQPEVSQGRLEALINFQTMVTDLTGLDIANSSMLDESTAVVEAMLLARRVSKGEGDRFLYDSELFNQTKALLVSRAAALNITLEEVNFADGVIPDFSGVFGLVVQYPAASGKVWNPAALFAAAKEAGATPIASADLLSLTLITSPGELGAEVAVGSTQRFGVPMGFGGPHAGFMAVRKGLERQLPGRLVGVSKDAEGRPAYRLSLQAREQHIRREKATSNICTAQVLLAVMASMYAVYHGPQGLRAIATGVHTQASSFADWATANGLIVTQEVFFDTVELQFENAKAAQQAFERVRAADYTPFLVGDRLRFSFDEASAADQTLGRKLTALLLGTEEVAEPGKTVGADAAVAGLMLSPSRIPQELSRSSEYLSHKVFNSYSSETRMMRYLKYLADLDYALDRGMIPLGSCTMKLNAATEMAAITWPGFAKLHPFTPAEDTTGYLELIDQLQNWLAELTGYDAASVQPNAGSQGELAGLLAIRNYHLGRGDEARTVCLIPSSAHGTNAASAVLAGMRVVVVACDSDGNVELADLKAKIAEHSSSIAALMITYPSTHGVYEQDVREICGLVHEAGGQVYIDGANLNALLGFAEFGEFGGDVSHLNLHKTFAIPHGGGGPGVGPVVAKEHLREYLPGHPQAQRHFFPGAPVSAAPYGSASILPISWAYIRMLGNSGLRQVTAAAVLSANYIAKRLEADYPVLYTGRNGLVAHECILDLRPLSDKTGLTVEDIAKRLIDYGFHAPTMSFPVAGTLMVEPTESEDLAELERFIAAMKSIRAEIDEVAEGKVALADSVLRSAPHTARSLTSDWQRAYSREQAVYPFVLAQENLSQDDPAWLDAADRERSIRGKYWAPVRRIDNAYGDRNLVCDCPPPEAFL